MTNAVCRVASGSRVILRNPDTSERRPSPPPICDADFETDFLVTARPKSAGFRGCMIQVGSVQVCPTIGGGLTECPTTATENVMSIPLGPGACSEAARVQHRGNCQRRYQRVHASRALDRPRCPPRCYVGPTYDRVRRSRYEWTSDASRRDFALPRCSHKQLRSIRVDPASVVGLLHGLPAETVTASS